MECCNDAHAPADVVAIRRWNRQSRQQGELNREPEETGRNQSPERDPSAAENPTKKQHRGRGEKICGVHQRVQRYGEPCDLRIDEHGPQQAGGDGQKPSEGAVT